MEGVDHIEFQGKKITAKIAAENYAYWKAKNTIPDEFIPPHDEIFSNVQKLHGAHTFGFKVNTPSGVIYPLLKIFAFNEITGQFENKNCGLICDKIRKGDGAHMGLARKLGLDKFVFSYMGMHLPYHREADADPIFPFGLFIKPSAFAKMHGSPCDRDYDNNDEADKANIDKYFLIPEDLQRVITNRVINDPLFAGDFWKYYGNPDAWEDETYRETQWKKKGEYCHFEKIAPDDIEAILWPVWEDRLVDDSFWPNELDELTAKFEETFNIQVIIYRPYGEIIDQEAWNKKNVRDWHISLVEASYLAHRYYNEKGAFPDSIKTAREYFKNKAA